MRTADLPSPPISCLRQSNLLVTERTLAAALFQGLYGIDDRDEQHAIANWVAGHGPRDPGVLELLVELYQKSCDLDGALRWAQRNVELHPELEGAHAALAETLLIRGEAPAARMVIERWAHASPSIASPESVRIGKILAAMENHEAAVRWFEVALVETAGCRTEREIEERDLILDAAVSSQLALERFDEAAKLVERTLSQRPSAGALVIASKAYRAGGRLEDMKVALEMSLYFNDYYGEEDEKLYKVALYGEGPHRSSIDWLDPLGVLTLVLSAAFFAIELLAWFSPAYLDLAVSLQWAGSFSVLGGLAWVSRPRLRPGSVLLGTRVGARHERVGWKPDRH